MNFSLDTDFEPIYTDSPFDAVKKSYSHYPILDASHHLLGIIEEEELPHYERGTVYDIAPGLCVQWPIHPYICMAKMKEQESNVLFVFDQGVYQGAITYASLIHYFQSHSGIHMSSAVLSLVVPSYIFSLAEVARIAESEGLKIASYHQSWLDADTLGVDLVFLENDLKRIVGILENKGYQVSNVFNEEGLQEHLKDRYENLMTYLNI